MLLVIGCGKPITENEEANVSESPKVIYLRAFRSFQESYYYDAKVVIDRHTEGSYSIPVLIDMTANHNGRWAGTWLHIEHNGYKHCFTGSIEYYYDHSRKADTECSSNRSRVTFNRFKAVAGLPLFMRIEKSECQKCGEIMAEAELTRI